MELPLQLGRHAGKHHHTRCDTRGLPQRRAPGAVGAEWAGIRSAREQARLCRGDDV